MPDLLIVLGFGGARTQKSNNLTRDFIINDLVIGLDIFFEILPIDLSTYLSTF